MFLVKVVPWNFSWWKDRTLLWHIGFLLSLTIKPEAYLGLPDNPWTMRLKSSGFSKIVYQKYTPGKLHWMKRSPDETEHFLIDSWRSLKSIVASWFDAEISQDFGDGLYISILYIFYIYTYTYIHYIQILGNEN